MKNSSKNKLGYIVSLLIVVASLVVTILDWTMPLNLFIHPLLNFLLFVFAGLGLYVFVLGFAKKSPAYFFLSAILLDLSFLYVLISYSVEWYICLVCVIVLPVIVMLLSLIVNGNKTEDIALNDNDDYKNYQDRKAEEEAKKSTEEKEELPEIKSFK